MNSLAGKRILIISHGHPDLSKGGAEMAAYNMFTELRKNDVDAYFLARTNQTPHGGAAFSQRNNHREILFHTAMDDDFLFSNIKTRHMWQEFRDLILLLKPDIVHLHHYFLLGIEILEEIRRSLPHSKIILTLHEYLAICHNKGLMVKTNGNLCYKSSARDCHNCFPHKQPGDFFLREQYIKRMFTNVDHFVSPSDFLKQRYVEWGLKADDINVIENGQPYLGEKRSLDKNDTERVKIAFFGQLNPFKGIDVLLKSIDLLPKPIKKKLALEIFGANFDLQTDSFQNEVSNLLEKHKSVVHFHGAYEAQELPMLMSKVDWIVVPSTWWENSPMVIQEAFNMGVPLIVSNIGGMAEKVIDGVDGLHFRQGSPSELADVLEECVKTRKLRQQMAAEIKPPMTLNECINKHLPLYK